MKQLLDEAVCHYLLSPPSRGRGLKLAGCQAPSGPLRVAPFTGAWIETGDGAGQRGGCGGRPLHGGVD